MSKNAMVLLALVSSMSAVAATGLHPADAFDLKREAEWAVMRQIVKAGEPKKVADGYEVPVAVDGKTCRVLVKPYTPNEMEPPIRWKAAGQPVCVK